MQSKRLLGLPCPRHHRMSHSVSQGHYLPRQHTEVFTNPSLGWHQVVCGEVLRDACVVALRLALRMQGVQLPEHTTLQLFRAPRSFQQHRRGVPKQPEPSLALGSGGILSDQPLISSASTAQASMQRSKMTFGFLQRTADNLVRLKNSLLSHGNHLRVAGQ